METDWNNWEILDEVYRDAGYTVDKVLKFQGLVDRVILVEARAQIRQASDMMKMRLNWYPFACRCDFEKMGKAFSPDEFFREYGTDSSNYDAHEMPTKACCYQYKGYV
jgi:hypothetical protein